MHALSQLVSIQIMDWNRASALDALRGSDLLKLGVSANQFRLQLHPADVVTYELRGRASSMEGAIAEVRLRGASEISLRLLHDVQQIPADALEPLLIAPHKQLPSVTFHHLPVFAEAEGLASLAEALPRLRAAGLRSIFLDFDAARSSAPSRSNLIALLSRAAAAGLGVSAVVTMGNTGSLEQRVETLHLLRELQQETGAFQSLLLCVHHAAGPGARPEEDATAVDYLRTLAVTRLFLDTIPHVQTDWSVMGPKVLELALRFGADDAGTIPWSQNGDPGPSHHGGESELRRIIRDAGFRPVERDALFRQSLLH